MQGEFALLSTLTQYLSLTTIKAHTAAKNCCTNWPYVLNELYNIITSGEGDDSKSWVEILDNSNGIFHHFSKWLPVLVLVLTKMTMIQVHRLSHCSLMACLKEMQSFNLLSFRNCSISTQDLPVVPYAWQIFLSEITVKESPLPGISRYLMRISIYTSWTLFKLSSWLRRLSNWCSLESTSYKITSIKLKSSDERLKGMINLYTR